MTTDPEGTLRGLAAAEEASLRSIMALNAAPVDSERVTHGALTPRIRMLVRLAALVVVDAPTTSLRWAVELAACSGASEDEIAGVLEIVSVEAGSAGAVKAAPRLALAMGYDIEVKEWNGT